MAAPPTQTQTLDRPSSHNHGPSAADHSHDRSCAVATTARTYYDSPDADTFYATIWCGSTINIGLYNSDSPSPSPDPLPIPEASHRTIALMASLITPPPNTQHTRPRPGRRALSGQDVRLQRLLCERE